MIGNKHKKLCLCPCCPSGQRIFYLTQKEKKLGQALRKKVLLRNTPASSGPEVFPLAIWRLSVPALFVTNRWLLQVIIFHMFVSSLIHLLSSYVGAMHKAGASSFYLKSQSNLGKKGDSWQLPLYLAFWIWHGDTLDDFSCHCAVLDFWSFPVPLNLCLPSDVYKHPGIHNVKTTANLDCFFLN